MEIIINYKEFGYSLIELLVAIGIISFVLVAGTAMFLSMLKGSNQSDTRMKIRQEGSLVLSKMRTIIRDSKSIISTCTNDAPLPSSFEVIYGPGDDNYKFNTSVNNEIDFNVNGTISHMTSSDYQVAGLTFSCWKDLGSPNAPEVITIKFVISSKNLNPNISEDFSSTFSRRSY